MTTVTLFGPAVAAANLAYVPVEMVNKLSVGYVLLRLAYVFIYVKIQENPTLLPLRPLAHWGSVLLVVAVYIGSSTNM
ncbi:hypothetical protein B0O99DRAFT_634211 [Bisporella sp. PMI_857]|nr:hypothetical protein B0O99DRAFT_634211 [Bisporella sp. PMI_857]